MIVVNPPIAPDEPIASRARSQPMRETAPDDAGAVGSLVGAELQRRLPPRRLPPRRLPPRRLPPRRLPPRRLPPRPPHSTPRPPHSTPSLLMTFPPGFRFCPFIEIVAARFGDR